MGDAASDEAGSDLLRQVSEGHGSVTLVTLWSLAATLPTSYFPSIVPGTNTATTVNSNLVRVITSLSKSYLNELSHLYIL